MKRPFVQVRRFTLLFAFLVGAFSAAQAQQRPVLRVLSDSNTVQELHLREGTKLVGYVTSIDGDQIAFRTLGGIELQLTRTDIVRVGEIGGFIYKDEFWAEDAAGSRLFVFPTGRVPEHGRGYFGVYELVVPSFGVGLGGIGMFSAGMSLIPGISLDEQVYYVAPKLQLFDVEYVQGAVGAMWLQPGDPDEGGVLGFATVTAGTGIASATGGIGVPVFRGESNDHPVGWVLGGELRVSRNIKLMNETWILPRDLVLGGFGLRILAGSVVVELAGVTGTNADTILPLVNVTFAW